MIKLYDLVGKDDRRFSPTCWRVKMALAHKGLVFETVPTPFTEIAAIGGGGVAKTVPVIEHDGRYVDESGRIALYLDEQFPGAPVLFGGAEAIALTTFVDTWVLATLHVQLVGLVIADIHDHCLDCDQSYFRESREARFGRTLEAVQEGREDRVDAFRSSLLPLRAMLKRQPFLGGDDPIYADYIVLGAFQWARATSSFKVLAEDDPVRDYLERLMDLHGGLARSANAYPL